MPNTSPGYSITVRVEAPAVAHATAALTTAVGSAGGALTALDVAESHADRIVVDVTCDASDVDHADRITEAIAAGPRRDRAQGQRPHLPASTSAARSR